MKKCQPPNTNASILDRQQTSNLVHLYPHRARVTKLFRLRAFPLETSLLLGTPIRLQSHYSVLQDVATEIPKSHFGINLKRTCVLLNLS